MELFERVKSIARQFSGSDSALAEALGLRQNTFSYYLSAKTQTKLWEHLPKILELHPQVRRDWLYFGEGEMTEGDGSRVAVPPMTTAAPPLRAAMYAAGGPTENDAPSEVAALRQKLTAAHELNARLTDEVLRLNAERRKLMECLEWEKTLDKAALLPPAARGGAPDEN